MKSYKREVSIQKRNREGEGSLYSCLDNRILNVLLLDCVMQAIYLNSDFARTFFTLQEHQRIRTFAIFQKFLTLKIVCWSMEKCIF